MAKQGLTLEQKQTQRMALEQQKLLGLVLEKNDAEMSEFIDNKVSEIQALEKKSDDDAGSEYDTSTPDDRADKEKGTDSSSASDVNTDGDDDTAAWYRYFANNRSRDDEYYAPTAVSEKTLQEYLAEQIGELNLDETQQIIARAIVGNLEDDGYLRRSVTEIADDLAFQDGCYNVDAPQVEKMLTVIQTLDPPGIAARGLQECMLLQLRRKPASEDVHIAIQMVEKYFDELVAMRFEALSRKMGVPVERLEDVFKRQIRRGLNPYPGNAYSTRSYITQQVTPDFDVELDEETGRLAVTLRNNIPALQISESYALMNERYKTATDLTVKENKEKKLIQSTYQSAAMFIEVIKQRQETLFNTMSAIVKCQREYFMSGDERDLKPLGQQQIADMIGKDVSVVSRAVNNKYVQLPWGIKSLKSFFSEDINGASRHEVYDDLKRLVEEEDKAHPLSDDALCDRLKEMGYQLERRTVAKYRKALGIESSTIRRRMSR